MSDQWQQRSLASLGSYENGFAFNDLHWSEHGLPIIRIAQITGSQGIVDRFPGLLPDSYRIDDGDLIFSWSGTLAVVRWAGGSAWLNQHLFKVGPAEGIDRSFLFHVLQASVAEMGKRTHGSTMKHIKRGELREFFVEIPRIESEQRKIAQILDTLDTAIRKTESMIDKLKAIKQGLLHDLLTRGIDANGQLRPPQSEAPQLYKESPLGWIPTEWKHETINSLIDGPPRNGIYKPAGDIGTGVLLVGQTAFTPEGSVDFNLARRARASAVECDAFGLQQSDLLVSRVFATREGVGQPVIVPELSEATVYESNMMRLRVRQSVISPQLLFLWLKHRAARAWIMSRAFASNQASINRETICSVPVPLPPMEEQEAILAVARAHDSRLDNEMCDLTKLQTSRTGLMDDLLTGRVRVTPLLESVWNATAQIVQQPVGQFGA